MDKAYSGTAGDVTMAQLVLRRAHSRVETKGEVRYYGGVNAGGGRDARGSVVWQVGGSGFRHGTAGTGSSRWP